MTTQVLLAIYDLSGGLAAQLSGQLLGGKRIEMVPHTGVRVFGVEYFYSGAIQAEDIASVEAWMGRSPVRVETIGTTSKTKADLDEFLATKRSEWTVDAYDVWRHNCNDFAKTVASFLCDGADTYPDWILRQPSQVLETPLGRLLEPVLQRSQALLNDRLRSSASSSSSSTEKSFELTIKRTSGAVERISVRPETTVGELRATHGRLVYLGKVLDDSSAISSAVPPGSTVVAAGQVKASLGSLDVGVLRALAKICQNVISHPTDPKFRTIKLTNAKFLDKVGRHSGAIEVLVQAGFARTEETLHLEPSAAKWTPLNKTKHALDAEIAKRTSAERRPFLAGLPSPNELAQLASTFQSNPQLAQSFQQAQRLLADPQAANALLSGFLQSEQQRMSATQAAAAARQPPPEAQPPASNDDPDAEDAMTEDEAIREAIRRSLREQ